MISENCLKGLVMRRLITHGDGHVGDGKSSPNDPFATQILRQTLEGSSEDVALLIGLLRNDDAFVVSRNWELLPRERGQVSKMCGDGLVDVHGLEKIRDYRRGEGVCFASMNDRVMQIGCHRTSPL